MLPGPRGMAIRPVLLHSRSGRPSYARAVPLALVITLILLLALWQVDRKNTWPGTTNLHKIALSISGARTGHDDWSGLTPLARLSRTLDRLDNTTILPYEDALKFNEKTCAGRGIQSNQDQMKGEVGFWRSLTISKLGDKRHNIVQGVQEAFGLPDLLRSDRAHTLYPSMWGDGRGIVFTGGNADTLQRLFTTIRILRRRLGCTLPIEVFAFPEEMNNGAGQNLRQNIEALGGVTFKELHSSAKLQLWKNFQIKGEALVASSFSEILYLDSDNVPLVDPTYLFDHPLYQEHGAVFWPDFTKDGPANPIWRLLGQQCRPLDWQFDSGQMLIDKNGQGGLNLAALIAASKMQEDHEFWFKLSGGDKDTFRYGFYALNLSYAVSPHWLSAYGLVRNYENKGHTYCGLAMLQYGLSVDDWDQFPSADVPAEVRESHAPPLFVHANLLKHYNSGGGRVFTSIKRLQNDTVDQPMERARSVVHNNWQGMCADVWDAFDDVNPRLEGNKDGSYENGDVITENSDVAFGGILRGFEDMFLSEGGRIGGF